MGLLVEGRWQDRWYGTDESKGVFLREQARFRDRVTRDGSSPFEAAAGRYHLYVSLACPWAHRVLITRALKRLEDAITVSIVDPIWGDEGWVFSEHDGCTLDEVNGTTRLHEIYTLARATYSGRVTVPVLWDKTTRTIVNNESSEIIRMLNSEFDEWGDASVDLCPDEHLAEIDAINTTVYANVNNGVYLAGFATTQEAYEAAFDALFAELDRLAARLAGQRYLVGDHLTEADVRLWTTLLRFDAVYYGHFKCNLRRIVDHPSLWAYCRDIYQHPGVAETVRFDHIKRHYYGSHGHINPTRIVPKGPALDFMEPHGRDTLG